MELNELYTALAAVQPLLTQPKRTSVNLHLRNKFADLAEVQDANRAVLAQHGLCIMQHVESFMTADHPVVRVITRLSHSSGQSLTATAELPVVEMKGLNMPQAFGVIVTYLRRYQWSGILGLASEPDDDGNEAHDHSSKGQVQRTRQAQGAAPAAQPADLDRLVSLIAENSIDKGAVCQSYSVSRLKDLSPEHIAHAVAGIMKKYGKKTEAPNI